MGNTARPPTMPTPIPDDWYPSERVLRENRIIGNLDEEELKKLLVEFKAFCHKNKLVKTMWAQCMVSWLKNKHDPKWVPKNKGSAYA